MLNQDTVAKLIYWIEEREHIREAKERGEPAPWTEDTLLQTYRFCNVCRRDDRVSGWLIENVYKPNASSEMLWLMAVCARWVNWPPTIKELIDERAWPNLWFNAEHFGKVIDARVNRGEKAWTGAYMIHSLSDPTMQKGMWLSTKCIQPLYEQRERFKAFFKSENKSVERAMALFDGCFNFGSFMAGQVVNDWVLANLLKDATDLYTFAPIGPGSMRGMNRLHDRGLEKPMKQAQFTEELQELKETLNIELPWSSTIMTAHDLQNCLCEIDKYMRLENGGSVRAKYQPETRF
jgi:hypothetical protein